jgi:ribosomal protein S30
MPVIPVTPEAEEEGSLTKAVLGKITRHFPKLKQKRAWGRSSSGRTYKLEVLS